LRLQSQLSTINKGKLREVREYDIVGFDAENSLVDYNGNITTLLVSVFATALHENWPAKYPALMLNLKGQSVGALPA
jgi:hypothetical protein